MQTSTIVKIEDLLDACEFASAGNDFNAGAWVSRQTGEVHLWSDAGGCPELPADIEDETLYLSVPHKHDLDLGQRLVFAFADAHLGGSADMVRDLFRKRGAYGRFKSLLERNGLLQAWYDFEAARTEKALREWAEESGLVVANPRGRDAD